MIIDQKKYSVNKNMILIAVDIDENRYKELRGILSECYTVYDASDEYDAVRFLDYNLEKVIAVLFNAENILEKSFGLLEKIDANKRFVMIPVIGVTDRNDSSLRRSCLEAGCKEYFEPPFHDDLIPIRLNNAARAKDSVTFHEMEMMLHELPSNIYLKDAEGKYIFSAHYWHHLKAKEPGWTIRGKTEFDIQKDYDVAVRATEADKKMIATKQGTNYILEINSDGIQEFIQVIKSPTYDSDGNVSGIIAIMNDVTELEMLKRKLEDRSERIDAELGVAAQIQFNMLPQDHAEYDGISISSDMVPAKNVGGDFYDFFFIDRTHLGLIIADVSGNGVPASLFMTIAKIVIHDRALTGGTPAEILYDANKRIDENNKMGLFVTVWFGILDTETGIITYTNAGHEYPLLRCKDGLFNTVETENCPPVATMSDTEYVDHTIDMISGGTLFLYTDGVPEAKNADGGRFGMDALLQLLNTAPDLSSDEIVKTVKQKIDEFKGDTEQFDDITMMCIKYNGTNAG